MEPSLRPLVVRALEALSVPYSAIPGGLEVRLPTALRPHFRGQSIVRLVFDEDLWQHDREAELVVMGSPFLVSLEEVLGSTGALSIRVGGEWWADPRWLEEFFASVVVLNGEHQQTKELVQIETAVSILYEVRVPGQVVKTELLPIGWHATRGPLSPEELAALQAGTWYSPEEAQGTGAIVSPALLEEARRACAMALGQRLMPFMALERQTREAAAASDEERFRADARARRAEAGEKTERLREIDEEEAERIVRLTRAKDVPWQAVEKTVQVWQMAQVQVQVVYTRAGSDEPVPVALARTRTGRLRLDLCGSCSNIARRYFLAPTASPTGLLCDGCGRMCPGEGCSEIVSCRAPSPCAVCSRSRYCPQHLAPCSQCDAPTCPEHGSLAVCCGSWLCGAHRPPTARDGRQLCMLHSLPCAVDGLWTYAADLVTCPITRKVLFRGNAVTAQDDPRLLHPDAVVSCRTTGVPTARDKAGICVVDGGWHRLERLRTVEGEQVCTGHAVNVDVPAGAVVRSDRVAVCSQTRAKLAQSAAGLCSVRGKIYDLRLLTLCPLTKKLLHRDEALRPPEDGRMLHPLAVVTCDSTGALVARDRAQRDELAPDERWLSVAVAVRCERSGKWTAARRTVQASCCARRVAQIHAVRLPDGRHGCDEHYTACSGEHPVLRSGARPCSACGAWVCPEHTGVDLYAPGAVLCAPHVACCRRCGLLAAHAQGAPHCRWCMAPVQVRRWSPAWRSFERLLLPHLPWALRLTLTSVRFSGTDTQMIYQIEAAFSGGMYRISVGELETKIETGSDSGWSAL